MTPELIAPENGEAVCPNIYTKTQGDDTDIILEWSAPDSATFSVVQICRNSSFSGPTFKAYKVTGETYNLLLIDDFSKGDTLYWRVASYDGDGGMSDTSETFSVVWDCGKNHSGTGSNTSGARPGEINDLCRIFDVSSVIQGPGTVLQCSTPEYALTVSWTCTNELGQELAELVDVTWQVVQQPNDGKIKSVVTEQDLDRAKLEVISKDPEQFVLQAEITFNSASFGEFKCYATKVIDSIPCNREEPGRQVQALGGKVFVGPQDEFIDDGSLNADASSPGNSDRSDLVIDAVIVPDPVVASATEGCCGDIDIGETKAAILVGPVVQFDSYVTYPEDEYLDLDDPEDFKKQCNTRFPDGTPIIKNSEEARSHLTLGCGVRRDGRRIAIDLDNILGVEGYRKGLKRQEEEYCQIAVYYGYGLFLDNEQLAVDMSYVAYGLEGYGIQVIDGHTLNIDTDYFAGYGLVSTDNGLGLSADLGFGLDFDATTAIEVDYGHGLAPEDFIGGDSNKLAIYLEDFLGANLFITDGGRTLNAYSGGYDWYFGHGLRTVADTVEVNTNDLAGDKLKADNNGLLLAVDTPALVAQVSGDGLRPDDGLAAAMRAKMAGNTNPTPAYPALAVNIGKGLRFRNLPFDDEIDLDLEEIAGDALGVFEDQLYVDSYFLAGSGLYEENGLLVADLGYGLGFGPYGGIEAQLGDGLIFDDTNIAIYVGEALAFDSYGALSVQTGYGLYVTSDNYLSPYLGEGLFFDDYGKITVDFSGQFPGGTTQLEPDYFEWDWSESLLARIYLDGPGYVYDPYNADGGGQRYLRVIQGTPGSTLAWGDKYRFENEIPPILSYSGQDVFNVLRDDISDEFLVLGGWQNFGGGGPALVIPDISTLNMPATIDEGSAQDFTPTNIGGEATSWDWDVFEGIENLGSEFAFTSDAINAPPGTVAVDSTTLASVTRIGTAGVLSLTDVTDPSSPSLIGTEFTFATTVGDPDVAMLDTNTLAVAYRGSSGDGELILIDITTRTSPSVIGSAFVYRSSSYTTPSDITLIGTDTLVILSDDAVSVSTITIVDTTTRTAPSLIGTATTYSTGAQEGKLLQLDSTTVAITYRDLTFGVGGKLSIWDVTTLSAPTQIGSDFVFRSGTISFPYPVLVDSNTIAVVYAYNDNSSYGTLSLVDITTQTTPSLIGSDFVFKSDTVQYPAAILRGSDTLFVAYGDFNSSSAGTYNLIDISTLSSPSLMGEDTVFSPGILYPQLVYVDSTTLSITYRATSSTYGTLTMLDTTGTAVNSGTTENITFTAPAYPSTITVNYTATNAAGSDTESEDKVISEVATAPNITSLNIPNPLLASTAQNFTPTNSGGAADSWDWAVFEGDDTGFESSDITSGDCTAVVILDDGRGIAAIGSNGSIYVTDDFGETWTFVEDLGNVVSGLCLNSSGEGVCTITAGGAEYTTDFGATWTSSSGIPVLDMYDCAINSDGQAVVVGLVNGTGGIAYSSNGGQTFTVSADYSMATFLSVDINDNDVVLVGESTGGTVGLVRSTNGGVNFSAVSGAAPTGYRDISLSNSGRGVLGGLGGSGGIYYTDDAGLTLSMSNIFSNFWNPVINNDGLGLAEGTTPGGVGLGVYETVDYGETWAPTSDITGDYRSISLNGLGNGLLGSGENLGIIIATVFGLVNRGTTENITFTAPAAPATVTVNYTATNTAGSDTESDQRDVTSTLGPPDITDLNIPSTVTEGDDYDFTPTNSGGTADSWDWTVFEAGSGGVVFSTSNLTSGDFTAVDILDDGRGVAGDDAGNVYITVDFGTTWMLVDNLGALVDGLCLNASGQGVCALFGGIVYYTVDSGATWLPSNLTSGDYYDCAINSSGQAVTVDNSQGVLYSSNGGQTFIRSADYDTITFVSVDINDNGVVLAGEASAVGTVGLIRSTDGGVNFTAVSGAPLTSYSSISLKNSGLGVVSGALLGIYYTDDAGVSIVQSDITSGYYKVSMDEGGFGIAAATGVLETEDGGETWSATTDTTGVYGSAAVNNSGHGILGSDDDLGVITAIVGQVVESGTTENITFTAPSAPATITVQYKASNSAGSDTASEQKSVSSSVVAPIITDMNIPDPIQDGVSYDFTPSVTGTVDSYDWNVQSDSPTFSDSSDYTFQSDDTLYISVAQTLFRPDMLAIAYELESGSIATLTIVDISDPENPVKIGSDTTIEDGPLCSYLSIESVDSNTLVVAYRAGLNCYCNKIDVTTPASPVVSNALVVTTDDVSEVVLDVVNTSTAVIGLRNVTSGDGEFYTVDISSTVPTLYGSAVTFGSGATLKHAIKVVTSTTAAMAYRDTGFSTYGRLTLFDITTPALASVIGTGFTFSSDKVGNAEVALAVIDDDTLATAYRLDTATTDCGTLALIDISTLTSPSLIGTELDYFTTQTSTNINLVLHSSDTLYATAATSLVQIDISTQSSPSVVGSDFDYYRGSGVPTYASLVLADTDRLSFAYAAGVDQVGTLTLVETSGEVAADTTANIAFTAPAAGSELEIEYTVTNAGGSDTETETITTE